MGEAQQSGLLSGDLSTCFIDDTGLDHEVRLQPPGECPARRVSDSLLGT